MTEKRFTYENHKVKDNLTGEFHSSNMVSVNVLNSLNDENEQLKQRLQKIQNSFEFNWTQNHMEYDKDTLHIKDNNTEIRLDGTNLFIEVYIPQINEYYRFKYRVTGRSLMREFIENYNSNGDVE